MIRLICLIVFLSAEVCDATGDAMKINSLAHNAI